MDASILRAETEPLTPRFAIPEAALRRFWLRLARDASNGEVLEASLTYGVASDTLARLVQHWLCGFQIDQQLLDELPTLTSELNGAAWTVVHARSREALAVPLLLLHGYSGAASEMAGIVAPLSDPRGHGAAASDAFHVVCPSLPSYDLGEKALGLPELAEGCASLMRLLGYTRYLVHGSDSGANLALALAELDGGHVAGLHVTALPAYPNETPEELGSLTRSEKSQLALLTQHRDELAYALPQSPIEELAFALARLEDPEQTLTNAALCDSLLAGLTRIWALGGAPARTQLYRRTRLAPAGVSERPVAVSSFPLDAPSLRRFAELRHRVVQWTEHAHGGPMPALEQPELLLSVLREFYRRFR